MDSVPVSESFKINWFYETSVSLFESRINESHIVGYATQPCLFALMEVEVSIHSPHLC